MNIQSLRIQGYRGYSEPQAISFAQPTGRPGSGLTVIVGPNNSGKSSVIEILQHLRNPGVEIRLSEGQRNTLAPRNLLIEYNLDIGLWRWGAQGSRIVWNDFPTEPPRGLMVALPARRVLPSAYQIADNPREHHAMNAPDIGLRQPFGQDYHISGRAASMEAHSSDVSRLFKEILGQDVEWYSESTPQGQRFIKAATATGNHAGEGFGDGVASVFGLIAILHDAPPNSVIAIEEPELSLHPAAQRRLFRHLAESARDKQIIITTHSPYFAPLEYLASGAQLVRTSIRGRSSTLNEMSTDTSMRLGQLLHDSNNPHVLGLQAREVFFLSDRIVLVEGQEDVVGYRSAMMQAGQSLEGDFFGWGAGGADKMPLFARAFAELGFRHVFGITDATHHDLAQSLGHQFPRFRFHSIPFSDIRDKPNKCEGILDVHWNLKPDNLPLVTELAGLINSYFAQSDR